MQVVQAIGAAEAELLNWGLPKRIDGDGAINLVEAAQASGVSQYIQVSSLGAGKFGWPAGKLLACLDSAERHRALMDVQ